VLGLAAGDDRLAGSADALFTGAIDVVPVVAEDFQDGAIGRHGQHDAASRELDFERRVLTGIVLRRAEPFEMNLLRRPRRRRPRDGFHERFWSTTVNVGIERLPTDQRIDIENGRVAEIGMHSLWREFRELMVKGGMVLRARAVVKRPRPFLLAVMGVIPMPPAMKRVG
jgi:hypothetical protein